MIFHSSKQKKRILSALLCGTMMVSAGAQVFAADMDMISTEEEIPAEQQIEQIETVEQTDELLIADDVQAQTEAAVETVETPVEEVPSVETTQPALDENAAIEWDEQAADVLPNEEESVEIELKGASQTLSQSGYALKRLGLVMGNEKGELMLTKRCTREEAFLVFLAVLGERSVAEDSGYTHPFKDVSRWASSAVGYGVRKGYTVGTGKTTFGSKDIIELQQYLTFILRALGYQDGVDFTWNRASQKALEIGFCSNAQMKTWLNTTFKRQQIMELSYMALNTQMKGSSYTVADKLISMGVITEQQAKQEGLTYHASNSGAENTAAASQKLNSVMRVYPNGTSLGSGYSFAGASQCMGFGREVFYRMYDQTARWNYDGSPKSSSDSAKYDIVAQSSSYSAASMKSLISKAKPGDILQMNSPKMHTMVFVSSDANGFTVYDANWVGANKVSIRYVSYGAWTARNSNGITVLHASAYPTII